MPRNHPLVKMTELREEGGSTLESLLTLIASHTISRLVMTNKILNIELYTLYKLYKRVFLHEFCTQVHVQLREVSVCLSFCLSVSLCLFETVVHFRQMSALPGNHLVQMPTSERGVMHTLRSSVITCTMCNI